MGKLGCSPHSRHPLIGLEFKMDGTTTETELELLKRQLEEARREIQDLRLRLENVTLLLKQEMALPKSGR